MNDLYRIYTAKDPTTLEATISGFLGVGWCVAGGLTVDPVTKCWAQAIYKPVNLQEELPK